MFELFFNKGEDKPKKKIFLFHNYAIINALLESETEATGAPQNAIVEDAIAERYLNEDEYLSSSVVKHFTEDGYIQTVTFDVMSSLAGMPEWSDDTVLPLIDFVADEQRHLGNHMPEDNTLLHHFSENAAWLAGLLEGIASEDELRVLKDLGDHENIARVAETINSGTTLSLMLDYIVKYAHASVGKTVSTHPLIADTTPYRLICDICRFDTWEIKAGDKYKFTMLVKNLNMEKRHAFMEEMRK